MWVYHLFMYATPKRVVSSSPSPLSPLGNNVVRADDDISAVIASLSISGFSASYVVKGFQIWSQQKFGIFWPPQTSSDKVNTNLCFLSAPIPLQWGHHTWKSPAGILLSVTAAFKARLTGPDCRQISQQESTVPSDSTPRHNLSWRHRWDNKRAMALLTCSDEKLMLMWGLGFKAINLLAFMLQFYKMAIFSHCAASSANRGQQMSSMISVRTFYYITMSLIQPALFW